MPALKDRFRVAVFDEFLDSFAALPRAQQKKVSRFMRKFRSDPTNSSINYEKIRTFADPNLRTVRIDKAYRAVVLKPEKGNVYVLLWVDHHDDAMAWAQRKKVVIHPETGSLQVLTAEPAERIVKPEPKPEPKPTVTPLFADFSDEDLASVAVPAELIKGVRAVSAEDELDSFSEMLPPDAYEALYFLSEGEPIESVRQALGFTAVGTVDPDDFGAALNMMSTSRRFALITDDQDLEAMLDAPLEKWRVFLHPSQRKTVEAHFRGPARVLGGAGTGKTVVAMHRAKHLATEVFPDEGDRILFTTFTKNLAADIQESLRKLCPPDILRRIEVVHLDKWVGDYLRRQGYEYRIAYYPGQGLRELWDEAVVLRPSGFTAQFLREEWEYVVQPGGCASWEDYRGARREGRGVRLSRQQRKTIWPVFEAYRDRLESKGLRESVDAIRDATTLLEQRGAATPYRSVVVDEAQDMDTQAFRLLRAIIPTEQDSDLFIVGDGHQRIYRRKVILKRAGVNIVGRSRKLWINYRTTDEIRKYAVALLRDVEIDDLDEGNDDNSRYKSLVHGESPTFRACKSFEEEVKAIAEFVRDDDAERSCLVTRTKSLLEQYESALAAEGIETYRVRRSVPEDLEQPGLRMATMHRVKGLEFDRVIVAGANDGVIPLGVGDLASADGAVREEAEKRERALLYVALTRARREAIVTCSGPASSLISFEGGSPDGTR